MAKFSLEKDPRVYAETVPDHELPFKRLLGLDLGTTTGVAWADIVPGRPVRDAPVTLGMWSLDVGQYDTGPLRHVRMKQFLAILKPDLIMFEDVKFTGANELFSRKTTYTAIVARVAGAAELLGGFKITLTTWAEERGVPAHGVPIGAIKKFATGKGNANKAAMIRACNDRFGTDFDPEDYESSGVDNVADAAFVLAMGMDLYSEGL